MLSLLDILSQLARPTTDEHFGKHCLEHTHPDFRDRVKPYPGCSAIVVAGYGFGVGSSREVAVSALKGCGVQCVISKSFAFIFGRNLPSLGLLGFNMTDDKFYEAARDGREIEIDVQRRTVRVNEEGEWKEWHFELSEMEYQLTVNHGVAQSFKRYGKSIWEDLMNGNEMEKANTKNPEAIALQSLEDDSHTMKTNLEW